MQKIAIFANAKHSFMTFFQGFLRSLKNLLALTFILALVFSCATIVTPTGGPKDVTPPKLVKSTPKNLSTNFHGDKLTIEFSEYIALNELEKYLLISPPLNKDPDIKIKGRSLVVRLKDTLRSNTTYSFYFGDAVVDLTEKNPFKNFSFALSTGNTIDSLSLSGKVSDAFSRLPMKDVLVMLYRDTEDSVPMLKRPVYVSRTGQAGEFVFTSLAPGKYRVIALKDGNNDYLYDLPSELIAFDDSLEEPYYMKSVIVDSASKEVISPDAGKQLSLSMFPEPDSIQRVSKSNLSAAHLMSVFFRYPTRNAGFIPLNIDSSYSWSFREYSRDRDTITCWLDKSLPDTLKLKVTDNGKIIDTLRIATEYKRKQGGKGRGQAADTTLRFTSNTARSSFLEWYAPYTITFVNPLAHSDGSGVKLIVSAKDTLVPPIEFADSNHRNIIVKHPWKTGEDYKLIFPKGAFVDIYGQTNDSVRSGFKLRPKEEYGIFRAVVTLVNISHPMIIQLTNEKGTVLKQQIITHSQKVDFGFLTPGKYGLKAIYDQNGNGRWDRGVYLKRIQPERVAIHPKTFDVRMNWELEEEWSL